MMFGLLFGLLAQASADSDALQLLQTSAHATVSRHNSTSSLSPGCKAATTAAKLARRSAKEACADEPVDYVEQPSPLDKYKIFPMPESADDLKSCDQGWMAHIHQWHSNMHQCWPQDSTVVGPRGQYKMVQQEMGHLTPDGCLQLAQKIIRMTGVCNPKATVWKGGRMQSEYQFTGCSVEFDDQSGPDVLKTPEHLLEEYQYNNLYRHPKFGSCKICGKGRLGPYTWEGNRFQGKHEVPTGVATLYGGKPTLMTCILNAEEKDQFEVFPIPLGNGTPIGQYIPAASRG